MKFAARVVGMLALLAFVSSGAAKVKAEESKQEVDLMLVLAVDISRSIDATEWKLEKEGYAEAFRNAEVIRTIMKGSIGSVAVTMVEWSGPGEQFQVVPWYVIGDSETSFIFAKMLEDAPRPVTQSTSISGGINFSVKLLDAAPFEALRRVIDVSGDGIDNGGGFLNVLGSLGVLQAARDNAVAKHIVINGLPILGDSSVIWPGGLEPYYKQYVIGGPGSFAIAAENFTSFAFAIRRKLVIEMGSIPASADSVQFAER